MTLFPWRGTPRLSLSASRHFRFGRSLMDVARSCREAYLFYSPPLPSSSHLNLCFPSFFGFAFLLPALFDVPPIRRATGELRTPFAIYKFLWFALAARRYFRKYCTSIGRLSAGCFVPSTGAFRDPGVSLRRIHYYGLIFCVSSRKTDSSRMDDPAPRIFPPPFLRG